MIGPFVGENKFLCNFSESLIRYEGITYPTVEHAFQAAKTQDKQKRLDMSQLKTPRLVKSAGRSLKMTAGEIITWNKKRISVMEEILRIKFQDPVLGSKLLATGNEELVEINHWYDRFWGVCEGRGENNLGKLLMKIRADLAKMTRRLA